MNIKKFKKAWEKEATKYPTPTTETYQIVDNCSPEVENFLDQIVKASPQELKKLLHP